MNMESTIEVNAVVTPNCAMASRSQTTSYRMLQKPETRKNRKNQTMKKKCLMAQRQSKASACTKMGRDTDGRQ